ncbi:MAG: tyrosine--tRNA ligase [Spirochaetaceae bacterium]|jgi:tyrosyl-tRNA synthetase|nr:tyrosine--tRNA ligase [Spirochaetaceae bacterium]
MNKALENLKERGFISQCTSLDGLSAAFDAGSVTFYVGCDPTGRSLHIGHMVPFFAFRHLLKAGHKGIALIGGGTARIGDPSGKTEMRKMLSYEELNANADAIQAQLERFFEGVNGAAGSSGSSSVIFANNKDWLAGLNYIDFLRDIGRHFSVNRMLSFEAYKKRMETGLSFIEFNYQLLQSYDFLQLYKRYNCRLQIGGDDQWGNIVAGMELIRRTEGDAAGFCGGLTFPLVTTADGKKMGKTEKGALFLAPDITSPYEFFQYWRNVQDADVLRFLLLFTFLATEECRALCAEGKNPNAAKERLAYEVTALIHGKDEAEKALSGARAAFGNAGNGAANSASGDISAMPSKELPRASFEAGYNIVDLFTDAGLAGSKSEARRLVEQGGAFAGTDAGTLTAITDIKTVFSTAVLTDGALLLRAGKKRYCRIIAVLNGGTAL